ncbi:ABC transporter permease [Amaricoccus solimangrovi]|nr:iron ABC transporter permease [Amaricoccus solimangrovi]
MQVASGPARMARPGWFSNPIGLLATALLIGVGFLVLYPVFLLIERVIANPGEDGLGIDASIWGTLLNTFLIVGGSSILALAFGSLLAIINERTDGSIRGLGTFMPVAPLMLPSITGVLGWVVLFDPRVGMVNVILRDVFGFAAGSGEGPINVYSWGGMLLAYTVHLVPAIYLIIAAALRSLDPSVEEASRIFGAGPIRTWWRVTLPAIRPALFEAWLLSVINAIAMFAVPVILGTGAGVEVISVSIWTYLTQYPPNQQAAIVLAGGMLAVVLLLRGIQWRLVPSGRQAVIGGRGVRGTMASLGALRHVARAIVIGYILISLVLPLIGLFIVSLEPFWTANVPWERLSFSNYTRILTQNPTTIRALVNSLILAAMGATIFMAVAAFLRLYARQSTGQTGKGLFSRSFDGIVDFVTSMPATLPHSMVGVAFILAFSRWPLDLYGTIWILLLAHAVMELPYASASAKSAASFIGRELAESSRIFRASEGTTMWRILVPLALPGLAAGWVLVFIKILGEVTASAILAGTSNPVVGSVLLDLWLQGNFPMMTAFALIIWVITSVLVILVLWLNNRNLARAR